MFIAVPTAKRPVIELLLAEACLVQCVGLKGESVAKTSYCVEPKKVTRQICAEYSRQLSTKGVASVL